MAKWARETKGYRNRVAEAFKSHLTDVAERFADHERVDSVSKKHIDEAFAALARLGLQSKTFWQRSDTWTAFGALLFGISFSMPDVCGPVCDLFRIPTGVANVASISLLVIFMGLGMALYFWARHHGSLPKRPGSA